MTVLIPAPHPSRQDPHLIGIYFGARCLKILELFAARTRQTSFTFKSEQSADHAFQTKIDLPSRS